VLGLHEIPGLLRVALQAGFGDFRPGLEVLLQFLELAVVGG